MNFVKYDLDKMIPAHFNILKTKKIDLVDRV